MKRLTRDISTAVLAWVIIEELQRIFGGIMIQGWLISLWHKFPFEIVTLSMTIFILICYEFYQAIILGMRAYERDEKEKRRIFDEFKDKTEKAIAELNEKYIRILEAGQKRF
jgi:hypothetical protein